MEIVDIYMNYRIYECENNQYRVSSVGGHMYSNIFRSVEHAKRHICLIEHAKRWIVRHERALKDENCREGTKIDVGVRDV